MYFVAFKFLISDCFVYFYISTFTFLVKTSRTIFYAIRCILWWKHQV